jgi:hypothetical protein
VIGNTGRAGMDHLGSLVAASVADRGVPVVAVPKTVDNHCNSAAQGANWFGAVSDVADCIAADSVVRFGYSAAADFPDDVGTFDSPPRHHIHRYCHLCTQTEKAKDEPYLPACQERICPGCPHLCYQERLVEYSCQCLHYRR